MEKIAISRDKDSTQFLRLAEKIVVRGARRKMVQRPAALVTCRSQFVQGRARKIFVEKKRTTSPQATLISNCANRPANARQA